MYQTWRDISFNWHHISVTWKQSRPFVTPVSHLFVVAAAAAAAQTPSQNLLFRPSPARINFLCLSFAFYLQDVLFFLLVLFHSAHRFTSKPDQLALDAFPSEPWEARLHTLCLLLSLCLSAGREQRGGLWFEEWTPRWTWTCRACVMWWGLAQGSLHQPQLSVITPEGVEDFSFLAQEHRQNTKMSFSANRVKF